MSNRMMTSRSIKALDTELLACRENLNTWFVAALSLLKLKKKLDRKSLTRQDRTLEIIAKSFSAEYYDAAEESDSEDETDDESDEQDDEPTEEPDEQDDEPTEEPVEEIIKREVLRESKHAKKPSSTVQSIAKTEMQNKALSVLTEHEAEQKDMDNHMDARRRAMQQSQKVADKPKSDVKFSLATDATNASAEKPVLDAREDNLEPDDEVLLEEDVTESVEPADAQITTNSAAKTDNLQARVLSNEEVAALGLNNTSATLEGIMPSSCNQVKFETDRGPPPAINALLKLSPAQRDALYAKLYATARTNVERQVDVENTDPEKVKKLIRGESDRLLQVYKETH